MIHKEKQKITFSEHESSGITIAYTKSREELSCHGWFDHCAGIEGGRIDFVEFCRLLGVEKKTLKKALEELTK
jgi:hypothetical protein